MAIPLPTQRSAQTQHRPPLQFPKGTTPELEEAMAQKAHPVALAALMAVPSVKGMRLRKTEKGATLTMNSSQRWLGIPVLLIAAGLLFWQWTTRDDSFRNVGLFHEFLWASIAFLTLFGSLFLTRKHRVRFSAIGFDYGGTILGIGLIRLSVWWEEIISIAKQATVVRQQVMRTSVPGVVAAAGGMPGYRAAVPIIAVRATCGRVQMGSSLNAEQRHYLLLAMQAYVKTWREVVASELEAWKQQQGQ